MQEISPADPSVRASSLPSVTPAGSVVFIMLLPPLCSLVWRTRWSDSRKLWSISQLPPNPAHLTWGPPLSSVSSKLLRTQVQKTGLLLCNLLGLLDVLLFTVNKTHLFLNPCFLFSLCTVPGFGPAPFGGPPGHMGPMQPGKNQVDSFSR